MVTRALRKNGDVSIIFSIVNIITVLNDSIIRFLELDLFMKYNCHFLYGDIVYPKNDDIGGRGDKNCLFCGNV